MVPAVTLDNIWGSGSWTTIFRNKLSGYDFNASIWWFTTPIAINAQNLYDNVIGNILGTKSIQTNYHYISSICRNF